MSFKKARNIFWVFRTVDTQYVLILLKEEKDRKIISQWTSDLVFPKWRIKDGQTFDTAQVLKFVLEKYFDPNWIN
jgi:hypothetical protein